MEIRARVENSYDEHRVTLSTNGNTHSITIPPKASGFGSSANGGELPFLALATCYCNDIYRGRNPEHAAGGDGSDAGSD